ncbi:phospholipid-translocating P-type ATPase [Rozella allomycis CSF55]|uniref:Phospholipid-transporting ATPase n=1 Tax=Rozella allomycis (strain CSF55) TaxID=988480 RepID=A0A4P9YPC4_ROZAC|nr:phospholipid-translocating P-type ATPase [Rozella allomycis CSF55]
MSIPLKEFKSKNSDAEDLPMLNSLSSLTSSNFDQPKNNGFRYKFRQFFKSKKKEKFRERTFKLNGSVTFDNFSPNIIRNQKYTIFNFMFLILFEQFRFFLNTYFLLIALSQLIPMLKMGYLVTYFGPLGFVLTITICKEAFDDYQRYKIDKENNSQKYEKLTLNGTVTIPSSEIKVGDLILVHRNQRVPADMILMRTTEKSGTCFIRTDQLDGETDWKLRIAVPTFQRLGDNRDIYSYDASVYAEKPHKNIYSFVGTISYERNGMTETEPLNAENMIWANTVVASGVACGCVVYTGQDMRAIMNTNRPSTKRGKIDLELNNLSKFLCIFSLFISFILVALKGFVSSWLIDTFRFLILFSYIIPISLRVTLDIVRLYYSKCIEKDLDILGTKVRSGNLPEELGRIEYLLTDKTGTLTKNEMELKKLHMGTISFGNESINEVANHLDSAYFFILCNLVFLVLVANKGDNRMRHKKRDISTRTKDLVQALALCHNVTPIIEDGILSSYQASSPDEIAIVNWTQKVGLTLCYRDIHSIHIRLSNNQILEYEVLYIFPFTSESKRMGIIVRERLTGDIYFYQKGADSVMTKIVQYNDWLDEECGNMAREGLRTLVIARKKLSGEAFEEFEQAYQNARISKQSRNELMQQVVSNMLEFDLELLGLTGVEDRLQDDVRITLELLRNAGIKIWMLTGDKIETATNIAVSTKLVSRSQSFHIVSKINSTFEAQDAIDSLRQRLDHCLVIDGQSLQFFIDHFSDVFMEYSTRMTAVVCCRCSPTQKAAIAKLIIKHTNKRVCCIGDGGNDVSMIQAGHVGVGIEGKEGRQASLAADFSVQQFSVLTKLLLWHGRNSYKRSSKVSQFIIHRGLVISIMQAVFSAIFYFAPIALFRDMLAVGYSTYYTSLPIMSLMLDHDVTQEIALMYPELYKDLTKGRSLTLKTFLIWLLISVFQGGSIMAVTILLFSSQFLHVISISFTALILNELLMVILEIQTWHRAMLISELLSLIFYFTSVLMVKTDISNFN